ncbi:hypothetical protein AE929_02300 [Xanthomonas arboricola]|nr:hypothetical protein AE920_03565 [Xanthomonas arboricola]OAH89883.1 hypothetical protein AXA70_00325 [Xanthomonas arboricola pv. juglandis]PPU79455.1 hypothetical protein XhhCFBP4925_14410 [Xanthomonas hortorum pv. hederae]QEW14667.1 hypothetical protein DYQ48_06375 [Xanthomonas hortorum]KOB14619.1 hypothetical protein AE924_13540 [Xanthomonas arboricola]
MHQLCGVTFTCRQGQQVRADDRDNMRVFRLGPAATFATLRLFGVGNGKSRKSRESRNGYAFRIRA